MVIHSNTWLYMAIHGNTWLYITIHGYTWQYVVIHSNTWLYMAIHGLTYIEWKILSAVVIVSLLWYTLMTLLKVPTENWRYTIHMILMMISAQVVETLVNITNNSPSRDYSHTDDQTTQTNLKIHDLATLLLLKFVFRDTNPVKARVNTRINSIGPLERKLRLLYYQSFVWATKVALGSVWVGRLKSPLALKRLMLI